MIQSELRLKHLQIFLCLFQALVFAACGPRPVPLPPTANATPFSEEGCYFVWATQPLGPLSVRIQKSMDQAGLKGGTASAQAYGENCYGSTTNQVVSFAAMETDIQIALPVKSIRDSDELGQALERILAILDGLPSESLSGGHLGTIAITYEAGPTSLHLFFTDQDARAARERGLHGANLVNALQNK